MTEVHSDLATLQRLMIVWEATAVLRHDLRNKLASVRNAAFFLQRKVEKEAQALVSSDTRVPTFFGMIRSETDAAVALIADRLPKVPGAPTAVDVDLAAAARDAVRHLRVPSGIDVAVVAEHARGAGDPLELALATLCLLENAVESGARVVRVECRPGVIEVIDDGPGLGDSAEHAFEHFFTTRPGHLGLGLPLARRLVERSGGKLALDAADGGGVRAAITLPSEPA